MATLNKFNNFTADLANGVHNLSTAAVTVALSNTAPVATNSVLADLVEISYTGLSSRVLTLTSSTQTSGTYRYITQDIVLSATATVGPFRYAALYNDTPTNNNLIGWIDLGSAITLNNGESLTLDFDNVNGILSLA
jgi:hypothetical protein